MFPSGHILSDCLLNGSILKMCNLVYIRCCIDNQGGGNWHWAHLCNLLFNLFNRTCSLFQPSCQATSNQRCRQTSKVYIERTLVFQTRSSFLPSKPVGVVLVELVKQVFWSMQATSMMITIIRLWFAVAVVWVQLGLCSDSHNANSKTTNKDKQKERTTKNWQEQFRHQGWFAVAVGWLVALVLLLAVKITMQSQIWEQRIIYSCNSCIVVAFVPLAVIIVALLLSRVPACRPGWEEMENSRENNSGWSQPGRKPDN